MSNISATTLPPKRDLEIGSRVGDFVVRELIANGGHSTVWRVERARSSVQGSAALAAKSRNNGFGNEFRAAPSYALKVLRHELAHDRDLQKALIREAKLLGALDAKYSPRIHQAGKLKDGRPFLVMEYLPGISLARYLRKRGSVELGECIKLLSPVAEILDRLHARNIIHRDIKPANIVIANRGTHAGVFLVDFGMATLAGPVRTVRGVPASEYWAPEQVASQQVDARTDVYSFGMLTVNMLTGQIPLADPSPTQDNSERRHSCEVAKLSGLSTQVRAVLERAISIDPSARYASCGEFMGALAAAALMGTGKFTRVGGSTQTRASSLIIRVHADSSASSANEAAARIVASDLQRFAPTQITLSDCATRFDLQIPAEGPHEASATLLQVAERLYTRILAAIGSACEVCIGIATGPAESLEGVMMTSPGAIVADAEVAHTATAGAWQPLASGCFRLAPA